MTRKLISGALTLIFILTASATSSAKVWLPQILGDHMVLQQQSDANLWGKASPSSKVNVKVSWSRERISTVTDSDGNWRLSVRTPEASFNPQSITISDKDGSLTLTDILIGEVWLCGGQSNMEMPLEGFTACPVEEADEEIALSMKWKGRIRDVKVSRFGAETPQDTVGGSWQTCSPETTRRFSAVGWFFAKMISEALDVPVGLLECKWGGSAVESWLPRDIVYSYPENTLPNGKYSPGMLPQGWYRCDTPIVMYNGMLYPVHNYTIRGFLWYQGETNAPFHEHYAERLATMVKVWRDLWGEGDIPFYQVELSPFTYNGDGTVGARIREAQHKAVKLIPNSGIAVTNDLVYPHEYDQIHPRQKRKVGERLAYLALNKTYGHEWVVCEGPVFKEIKINGSEVEVYFDNKLLGLSPWHGITGFELAGEDGVFHPAQADLIKWAQSIITVKSDEVPAPVAVRYCFRDFQPGNLKGRSNIPVAPFRSDNW